MQTAKQALFPREDMETRAKRDRGRRRPRHSLHLPDARCRRRGDQVSSDAHSFSTGVGCIKPASNADVHRKLPSKLDAIGKSNPILSWECRERRLEFRRRFGIVCI
jgi:hypothetical protein